MIVEEKGNCRKREKTTQYLHDVIFGEQRVDAPSRHAGQGDAHDA